MSVDDDIEALLNGAPPVRHYLFWLGPLSFYWIWINEESEHQCRCWTACWHTRNNVIHLAHWKWWEPLRLMPKAIWLHFRATRKALTPQGKDSGP